MKFSFYQTKHMAVDFKTEDLTGTLQNILIFLARNGNDVLTVEPTIINSKGTLVVKKFSDFKKPNYKGLKITYNAKNSDSTRELYYFSGDISNLGFKQDTAFYQYLSSLDFDATFLKSASFLMHKDYFSNIRTLILNKSEYILQDDSGVPFRFFKPSKWSTKSFIDPEADKRIDYELGGNSSMPQDSVIVRSDGKKWWEIFVGFTASCVIYLFLDFKKYRLLL
ncbi:MAG: hypothetical protein HYZ42_09850 [Bacteroidetes bacterium]|nr:hypothetical protein [Bacteroidota bacterium]